MNRLQKQGYAIEKLRELSIINKFKELAAGLAFEYAGNVNKDIINYDTSLFESDILKKDFLFKTVVEIFSKELEKVLPGYKPLMVNYWAKKPGHEATAIHQNWSHVDEKKYRSYTIWIPLQDTDKTNGTMFVTPYSHLLFPHTRALNSKSYLLKGLSQQKLHATLVEVKLKMGDYLIFDDGILHYSPVNTSQTAREAIQLVVIPEEAPGKFYNKNNATKLIAEYDADENFYRDLKITTGGSTVPQYAVKKREFPETDAGAIKSILLLMFNRIFRYPGKSVQYDV